MSYHLSGAITAVSSTSMTSIGVKAPVTTTTTAVRTVLPTSTATSAASLIARVESYRGNAPALQKLLADLKSKYSTVSAALAKSPGDAGLKMQLKELSGVISLCTREIANATRLVASVTPVPGPFVPGVTKPAVIESNTIAVKPNGQIVPGPGAQVVTTPEVGPSSGAEIKDVTVSSGSIGTVIFVGGLIGLAYLMLRKKGAA